MPDCVCPFCDGVFPVESGINDMAARHAVAEAFALTPFGNVLLQYVNLFRPPKRALAWPRAAKLLGELLPMIRAAQIERNGRIYAAPISYWQQALDDMLAKRDSLTLPLKSHGYLLTIIVGYSDKAEARHEARTEEERRHRPTEHVADACKMVSRKAPEHVRKQLQKFLRKEETNGNPA